MLSAVGTGQWKTLPGNRNAKISTEGRATDLIQRKIRRWYLIWSYGTIKNF